MTQETTFPTTFRAWLAQELESDTIKDLAEHGAAGGFPGLTYYSDTCALYDAYEEEIWKALYEDADDFGSESPLALIASFNGAKDVTSDTTFKNLLTWYMAERIAREIVEEEDDA